MTLPSLTDPRPAPLALAGVVMAHGLLAWAVLAARAGPEQAPAVHAVAVRLISPEDAKPAEPTPPVRPVVREMLPAARPEPQEVRQPSPLVTAQPVAMPAPAPAIPVAAPAPALAAPVAMPAAVAAPTQAVVSAPAAPAASREAPAVPLAVVPPRFDADYLDNPPPAYPALSRRLGEEGRVMLRVYVRPDGRPAEVAIRSGSGSERLDRAAQEAVRRWRFVPARQGDERVGAWVQVPISFSLGS